MGDFTPCTNILFQNHVVFFFNHNIMSVLDVVPKSGHFGLVQNLILVSSRVEPPTLSFFWYLSQVEWSLRGPYVHLGEVDITLVFYSLRRAYELLNC